MEQLDEHLSGAAQSSPPSFMQVGSTLFIYFTMLITGIIVFYAIFESDDFQNISNQNYGNLGILVRYAVFFLVIEFLAILSNTYLQGRVYDLLNQSVLKTTILPILLWAFIISVSFFNYSYQDSSNTLPSMSAFIRIGAIFSWYSILCLIIASYFKHQNSKKYYGALFLHWCLAMALYYFLYYSY